MEKQEKQAIEILHMMCGNNGCVISDSGGKDSSVLKHIALKTKNMYGLEYKIRHNHTTVDAPETVYFIRKEKQKYEAMGIPYEIFYPAETMWQLIVRHGTPPTRKMRYVMEIGKKGALHHHLVINTPEEISQQAIVRCWKGRGRTHHNPLDDTGQYAKLASYLIKQSDGMLRSPDALQGKRWNSSRNLRKPKILRKEPVKDKGWYNRIARLPKKLEQSYYLDGDSVQEGIHEKTGYTFFTYTFVKINQTWKETELEWDKL